MAFCKSCIFRTAYINLTLGMFLLSAGNVRSEDALELGNFTIQPSEKELELLYVKDTKYFHVIFPHCEHNYTFFETSIADGRVLKTKFEIIAPNEVPEMTCFSANVSLRARNVGESSITFRIIYPTSGDPCKKEVEIVEVYVVKATRKPHIELDIFRYGTMFFLIILNFGFGCSLNLDVVKEILKKPFAPAVGFCCQYGMMPIIGFCVSMTLLRDYKLFGFGLICSSCAPGGSGSNVWCLLLGGDVSLSLTMTFFSISASLVMMPLWIYLEGRFFIDTDKVAIPYLDILSSLIVFVIPLFIGVIFRKFKEYGADMVGKFIKPFAFLFLVFLLTFGLYTNRYIYSIIGAYPFVLIPALLQPYLGFGIGFSIARVIGKQPKKRAITIAIETGVQNIAIPMVLLQNSFVQPLGDIAAVMPVTTAHFTPLPLMIAFVVFLIRNRLCPPAEDKTDADEDEKDEEELNKHAIEPMTLEITNGGSVKPRMDLNDIIEKDMFLSGIDKTNFEEKYSKLDKETVI